MGRREVADNSLIARSRVAALGSFRQEDPPGFDRGPGHDGALPQGGAPPQRGAPPHGGAIPGGGTSDRGGAFDPGAEPEGAWPFGGASDAATRLPAPEPLPSPEAGWRRWAPAAVRDASLGPGRRGLLALAVVAVLVALVAGVAAWRARPEAEPVVTASIVDAPSTSPSASPAEAVVAVSGRVRRPGLVRLPAGSRVADALAAAGGALPGADLSTLNLARKVVDGELIAVGVPAPAGPVAGGPPAAGAPAPGTPLDLNTATAEQLDALPGVGPVLAERIVTYRTDHGGFRSVDELRQVEGIGDTRFEKLRELVRV
ncbi:ComEA family DNA-binding protein [Cryptosporangium minutisporangium]|uniref:Helix-hairpin-helix DNA-binding motif class 1 domain-containing protein n=1 Tax=Cryptosporangium minutisporangium TaxID=113569 RepID=A0ABP6T6F6_9ACTN